jgi:DNA repair exonuclease SbcCD ATPase subunit
MAVVQKIDAILGVQRRDWQKGLKAAGDDVKNFRDTTTGILNDLNAQFGKRSLLGKTMKLLAGGGAIAAVSMAANEFKAMSDKVLEVADSYRKGETSSMEFAAQMIRSIPILGKMTEGFDSLREAITGERFEVEKLESDTKRIDASVKVRNAIINDSKKAIQEWAKEIRKARDEWTLLNTLPQNVPAVKGLIEQKNELADKLRKYQVEAKLIDEKTGGPGELTQTQTRLSVHQRELQPELDRRNAVMKERNAAAAEFNAWKKSNPYVGSDMYSNPKYRSIGSYDRQIADMDAKMRDRENAIADDKAKLTTMQAAERKEFEAYQTWKAQYEKNQAKEGSNAAHKANQDAASKVVNSWIDAYDKMKAAAKEWTEADKKAVHDAAVERQQAAASIVEENRTPMEKYGAELKRLQSLYNSGDLDRKSLGRAAKSAYASLIGSTAGAATATRLMAEEWAAPRTVTASDVPAPLTELANTAQKQLDALLKLVGIAEGNGGTGTTINVVEIP